LRSSVLRRRLISWPAFVFTPRMQTALTPTCGTGVPNQGRADMEILDPLPPGTVMRRQLSHCSGSQAALFIMPLAVPWPSSCLGMGNKARHGPKPIPPTAFQLPSPEFHLYSSLFPAMAPKPPPPNRIAMLQPSQMRICESSHLALRRHLAEFAHRPAVLPHHADDAGVRRQLV